VSALIVCGLVVILLWALVGRRLETLGIPGPLVIVVLGVVAGALFGQDLGSQLNTDISERVVEIILAILLFVDATEVRRGFFGGEARLIARLLAIALPLSLLAAVGAGALLIPGASWPVLLVIACVVIPTDFAAATAILRERRLPGRLRHVVNVESGYNDGIVSPLFLFALAIAGGTDVSNGVLPAIGAAVWASVVAVVVGTVIGGAAGIAIRHAVKARWVSEQSMRIGVVVIPLLVYVVDLPLSGNGFVAAFVAGIAFRIARAGRRGGDEALDHHELTAVEDVGLFTSYGMWFVFGAVTLLAFETGLDWRLVLFSLLALTVLRMLPVYLSLLGSTASWRERTVIGLAGPRGTASIVFGLLAYNALRDDDADTALYVTVIVVLGSIILHGALAPRLAVSILGTSQDATEPRSG
jgi:NhaP-type Na+/H+ or K+/H+ antiporter